VRVELTLTGRTVDLIQEGYDLAIRAGRIGESSLLLRKLGTTSLELWASKDYLDKRGRPTEVSELEAHDCVLFKPFGVTEGRSEWTLETPRGQSQTTSVRGPVTVDDLSFVVEALTHGAGIGLLPSFVATRARPNLEQVLPGCRLGQTSLSLLSLPRRYEPRSVKLFRELLLSEWPRLIHRHTPPEVP
jgi:DNA-binding transcriptional LysR family regulator